MQGLFDRHSLAYLLGRSRTRTRTVSESYSFMACIVVRISADSIWHSTYVSILIRIRAIPQAARDVSNDWLVSHTGCDGTMLPFGTRIDLRTDTLYYIGCMLFFLSANYGDSQCLAVRHKYMLWKHVWHWQSIALKLSLTWTWTSLSVPERSKPHFSLQPDHPISASGRLKSSVTNTTHSMYYVPCSRTDQKRLSPSFEASGTVPVFDPQSMDTTHVSHTISVIYGFLLPLPPQKLNTIWLAESQK